MAKGVKTRRGKSKGKVNPYLYNSGDENTLLTGGWVVGYSDGSGTQTKESNHLYLYAYGSSYVPQKTYVTNNAINMTNINTLKVDWEKTGSSYGSASLHLIVSKIKEGNRTQYDARVVFSEIGRTTSQLDVSSLSGEYYVRINANSGSTLSGNYISGKVYSIEGL